MNPMKDAQPETVGAVMSRKVPTCRESDGLSVILANLTQHHWDDINWVYVLGSQGELVGCIEMRKLMGNHAAPAASSLMRPAAVTLQRNDDQEVAVFQSIDHDLTSIPVVDDQNRFLGAITAKTILAVMREEHLEDALITAGMHGRGAHILKLASGRIGHVIKARAPWLMVGLLAGLGLGLISSWFEAALQKQVAIAYFIPVVAYIADSVGTQTEAITVRALAVLKINYGRYLLKELLVGIIIGVMVAAVGGMGAALIAQSTQIGLAVGLSLLAASTLAAVLASLIPMAFMRLGKDPALGSGPLATALQDVFSVVVYFLFALALVR